jgi:hypothetical protein
VLTPISCTYGSWPILGVERAMGIEPTRKTVLDLENKQFGAITNAKCDGRVNFRGTWDNVGIR